MGSGQAPESEAGELRVTSSGFHAAARAVRQLFRAQLKDDPVEVRCLDAHARVAGRVIHAAGDEVGVEQAALEQAR